MTTILYTPSNEEILETAKTHPELTAQLKTKVLNEIQNAGLKYIERRLKQNAEKAYNELFTKIEKKFFNSNGYNSYSFDKATEQSLIASMEKKLAEELEEEFEAYINSDMFKEMLKKELQKRVADAVLKGLEAQINQEAKKLLSA